MEQKVELMLRGRKFMSLIDKNLSAVREKYDLKNTELQVILYLANNGECNTASDINCFLKLNKGYLSQTVDSLCKKGYLTVATDESDRRYQHYLLTDSAENIFIEAENVRKSIEEGVFSGIDKSELELLKSIAERISSNIDKMLV